MEPKTPTLKPRPDFDPAEVRCPACGREDVAFGDGDDRIEEPLSFRGGAKFSCYGLHRTMLVELDAGRVVSLRSFT